ncbi:hypothetical protein T484DRAFT_1763302 [Baffinella frigidus]|nr:hypothetical protein T484DRAFT_1763302 [Cryptophyta sp. CCMP2293]
MPLRRAAPQEVLHKELTPLCHDAPSEAHDLACFLVALSPDVLRHRAPWFGGGGAEGRSRLLAALFAVLCAEGRSRLLASLFKALPPSVRLSPHRLETLVSQALELQMRQCS